MRFQIYRSGIASGYFSLPKVRTAKPWAGMVRSSLPLTRGACSGGAMAAAAGRVCFWGGCVGRGPGAGGLELLDLVAGEIGGGTAHGVEGFEDVAVVFIDAPDPMP